MILTNNKLIKTLVLFSLLLPFKSAAQEHLSRPYSRFAWGEMQPRSSTLGQGMGGTSYAYHSPICINVKNPASYTAFDSLSSLIEAAITYDFHVLQERGQRQQGSTMQMDYLYLGLPVASRWMTAFGIQPFSMVSYDYTYTDELSGREDIDKGSGGVYELFWGNAFRITPQFSAGIQASYLFGTVLHTRELYFKDAENLSLRTADESEFRGLLLQTGLQYDMPIGKKNLGFGMVYTPSVPALLRADQRLYRLSYRVVSGAEEVADTLAWDEKDTKRNRREVCNPTVLGFGVSLSESERFWIGADFTWSDWSRFSIGGQSDSLADSWRASLGGRWVPNTSASGYLSKMAYSMGVFYGKDALLVGSKPLHRMGMSLGVSFPMKKSKTRVGLCLESGSYGIDANTGIHERYNKLTLHMQLHESWYKRGKLE